MDEKPTLIDQFLDAIFLLGLLAAVVAICLLVVLVVGTIYLEIRSRLARRRARRFKGYITDAIQHEKEWPR